MNPYFIIAIMVLFAGSNAATYFYAVDHTENRVKADQAAMKDFAREVVSEARVSIGTEVAEKIAGLRPVYRTINQETIREIRENPVYLNPDCAVPVSGVMRLNASRLGAAGGAGSVNDGDAAGRASVRPVETPAAGRPSPR